MLGIKEVDVAELLAWRAAQDDRLSLIDVRMPAEVMRGAISGARNVPLHMIPMVEHELTREVPLVLYCQTGARSAQACAFLSARGWDNVYNLRGGIMAWLRSGQDVALIESQTGA